jgi:hypothetical protein
MGDAVDEYKYIAITRQEAELIMDTFRVTNPATRSLVLKIAGMVLEFAAQDSVTEGARLTRCPTSAESRL